VRLESGKALACDFVVMGVGVRPEVALAESAGLTLDNGIVVDAFLETSVPGIYAAGDVARYPLRSGKRARIEHWVHAERQGQVAAQNILGRRRRFTQIPFFWSAHYDVAINYVGHADTFDKVEIVGSLEKRDCVIAYRESRAIRAIATIGRDKAGLLAEAAMERGDTSALEAVLRA
jgi:NADPH-dependent 2,4-dienoyl-CoA reductase/sulfur reductase-like enzyme